jgi:hypothetical protein
LSSEFKGYLDRLRLSLETLDSAIDDAKAMVKTGAEGRARLKAIRDLVELRNSTLEKIKSHLLGRDQTGAINEPGNVWDYNAQIEYERLFASFLRPWKSEWLKLECKDCGEKSEEVRNREIKHGSGWNATYEHTNLCPSCHEKRKEVSDK